MYYLMIGMFLVLQIADCKWEIRDRMKGTLFRRWIGISVLLVFAFAAILFITLDITA